MPIRPAGWTATFGDDFNGSGGSYVDQSAWIPQAIYYNNNDFSNPLASPNYSPGRYDNSYNRVAYYLPGDSLLNGDGNVNLISQTFGATPGGGNYGDLPYSRSFMITRSFQQAYGYFEVRMKPGITRGVDLTFWLIHNNSYPEIDIAEFPGGDNINIWGIWPEGRCEWPLRFLQPRRRRQA